MIAVTWFIWSKFWHHHASLQLSILVIIRPQGLKTLILALEACLYQFQTAMLDLLLVEHQLGVHDDEARQILRLMRGKKKSVYAFSDRSSPFPILDQGTSTFTTGGHPAQKRNCEITMILITSTYMLHNNTLLNKCTYFNA